MFITFNSWLRFSNIAYVQPDFKWGKVSLRIREQYRIRAILWIAWISVFKRNINWLLLRSLIHALRLANSLIYSFEQHSRMKNMADQNTKSNVVCDLCTKPIQKIWKVSHWGFSRCHFAVCWTEYINELANRGTCIKLLSNSQSHLNTEIHAIQKMARTRHCSLIDFSPFPQVRLHAGDSNKVLSFT